MPDTQDTTGPSPTPDGTRFRTIIEKSLDAVVLFGGDGTVKYATPSSARLMGYDPTELAGTDGFERVHPDDRTRVRTAFGALASDPDATLIETYRVRHKDGRWRWLEARAVNLLHEPSVAAVAVTYRDMTHPREAEDAHRAREELLRAVIDHIPCGVFWKDRASIYLGCNDLFARNFGLSGPGAVVGRSDADLGTTPAEVESFRACDRRVMETGEPLLGVEESLTRLDGSRAVLLTGKVPLRDAAGAVVGVLGVYQDITERKHLEDQLRQAQKMEAVGQLAGGVAHDFNNLLTVINGYSDIVLTTLHAHDPARPMVEEVKRAGERAASLTNQLLAFGRKQVLQPKVLDLNEVVAGVGAMLRWLLGEDVGLVLGPDPDLLRVKADPGQVGQVLMNLAVNARDAMPTGGTLTVETRNVALGAGTAPDGAEVRAGPYVLLAVSDTGAGMTQEVRNHMFEPFFTTKEQGKGTGLGLATVYGIVKQSGGHVEVESAVGRGSTFRVYLPGIGGSAPGEKAVDGRAPPRGAELVLLVEDEAGVRGLAELALRKQGYTVLTAGDAEEALAIAARSERPVDLLLTDVVMPGAGGRALAERLWADRPELKVVFVSGYTDDAVVRHGVESARVNFLQKPFTPDALARKVREVLDSGPPQPSS